MCKRNNAEVNPRFDCKKCATELKNLEKEFKKTINKVEVKELVDLTIASTVGELREKFKKHKASGLRAVQTSTKFCAVQTRKVHSVQSNFIQQIDLTPSVNPTPSPTTDHLQQQTNSDSRPTPTTICVVFLENGELQLEIIRITSAKVPTLPIPAKAGENFESNEGGFLMLKRFIAEKAKDLL